MDGNGENGNWDEVLSWEWEGLATVKVIPTHLYYTSVKPYSLTHSCCHH